MFKIYSFTAKTGQCCSVGLACNAWVGIALTRYLYVTISEM